MVDFFSPFTTSIISIESEPDNILHAGGEQAHPLLPLFDSTKLTAQCFISCVQAVKTERSFLGWAVTTTEIYGPTTNVM